MYSFYISLFVLGSAFLWVLLLYGCSYVLVYRSYSKAKLSPYECGFLMNKRPRGKFEIRFFVVALLFLIMDLEIVLLLPGVLGITSYDYWGYIVFLEFLILLFLGLWYEWLMSAIEW